MVDTIERVLDMLPDVTLPLLDGSGELRLSELRGKRRLLFFWGSW
ncbi:MAG: peroxiredoxin family protein [Dehalococcoidia bacterium]